MSTQACPYCTYKNSPTCARCSVCSRNLRKTERQQFEFSRHTPEDPQLSTVRKKCNVEPLTLHISSPGSAKVYPPFTHHTSNAFQSRDKLSTLHIQDHDNINKIATKTTASTTSGALAAGSGRVETLFTTASGKTVTVSEKLLEAAKARLGEGVAGSSGSGENKACGSTLEDNVLNGRTCRNVPSGTYYFGRPGLLEGNETRSAGWVTPSVLGCYEAKESGVEVARVCSGELRVPVECSVSSIEFDWRRYRAPVVKADLLNFSLSCFLEIWTSANIGEVSNLMEIKRGYDDGVYVLCVKDWQMMLCRIGASPSIATEAWCRHALLSTFFLIRTMSLRKGISFCASAPGVLLCIARQYNLEFPGRRCSVFLQILRGNVSPALPCVLFVSSVLRNPCDTGKGSIHKRVVTLSDGYYHVRVRLDIPLSCLVRMGKIAVGTRIAICGARLLVKCGDMPLDELWDKPILEINYNCTRLVQENSALGLCAVTEPEPVPISCLVDDGGIVSSIKGMVVEYLPTVFAILSRTSRGLRRSCVLQNTYFFIDSVRNQEQLSMPVSDHKEEDVYRVSSCLLQCESTDVIIQQWEHVHLHDYVIVSKNEKHCFSAQEFPRKNSSATFYALLPCIGRKFVSEEAVNPSSNLFCGPAFFTTHRLHYRVHTSREIVKNKDSEEKEKEKCFRPSSLFLEKEIPPSVFQNVCGIFLGRCPVGNASTAFLLLVAIDVNLFALIYCSGAGTTLQISFPPLAENSTVWIKMLSFVSVENEHLDSDCCLFAVNIFTAFEEKKMDIIPSDWSDEANESHLCRETGSASTQEEERECTRRIQNLQEWISANPMLLDSRRKEIFEMGQNYSFLEVIKPELLIPFSLDSVQFFLPDCPASSQCSFQTPYYLRESRPSIAFNSPEVTCFTGASHSPSAVLTPSLRAVGAPSLVARPSVSNCIKYRGYGNILSLVFIGVDKRNTGKTKVRQESMVEYPLFDALRMPTDYCKAWISYGQWVEHLEVTWRYGVGEKEFRSAVIKKKNVLHHLFESLFPLSEFLTAVSDESSPHFSSARKKLLELWNRDSSKNDVWYRVFLYSTIETTCSTESCRAPLKFPWNLKEWHKATEILHGCLSKAFFKFVVEGNEVERVYLISTNCLLESIS